MYGPSFGEMVELGRSSEAGNREEDEAGIEVVGAVAELGCWEGEVMERLVVEELEFRRVMTLSEEEAPVLEWLPWWW